MLNKKKVEFYLPYPAFDTHFHAANMKKEDDWPGNMLSIAFNGNLVAALDVAIDEKSFSWRCKLADRFKNLYLSAGIHPSSVSKDCSAPAEKGQHSKSVSSLENNAQVDWDTRFGTVKSQCMHPAVIAVGETGLDFYRNYSPREHQELAFRCHLELAVETGLPVIVHNRNADEVLLAIIRESACNNGVFHCFSSNWKTAKTALDLGYYISFAGNLSYKNANGIRAVAPRIPRDRLLIETDSPYLSPEPMRGRVNHPGHIGYTLEVLANLRKEDIGMVAESLVGNAFKLFGLPRARAPKPRQPF